jgi:2-haloacid dehalogenase
MLDAAVHAAGLDELLNAVLSVHLVKKFKTAPEAYQLGTDTLGLAARDMLFVSSNAWDICGAAWFGYPTFWVNRANAPMEELGVIPKGIGTSLNDLLSFVAASS